jgi:V8-like Glu-specific endopeptidase
MSGRTWRFTSATVALLLVVAAVLPLSVGFAQDADKSKAYMPLVRSSNGPEAGTMEYKVADPQAVEKIWTAEARASAKPLPMPEYAAESSDFVLEESFGTPGFAPGGAPDPGALDAAKTQFSGAWADAAQPEVAETPEGTAGVYTTYKGNYYYEMWYQAPYRAVGKLYFQDQANNNYYCTASVISGKNFVVTAAHCTYDTGINQWYKNWLFVPTERYSSAVFGLFPATNALILTAYSNAPAWGPSYIRYDVSLVSLGGNSYGQPVTYYTGWMGRSWNWGYTQSITEIAYPSNLSQAYTNISQYETFTYGGYTNVLFMGTNMGSGASGAPMLRLYAPYNTNNYVNGTHSGVLTTNPTRRMGARFVDENIVVLCNAWAC